MPNQYILPSRPLLALVCGLVLLATALLHAGPLNPPPGPVASTYKTLAEVEPRIAINATNTPGDATCLFRITQPGSYYLTGNIAGVTEKHGIAISASGVTIDLNGFEVVGAASVGATDAIVCDLASQSNITILNGTIRNWTRDGINLGENNVARIRIEGVQASGIGRIGIYVGTFAIISRCSASGSTYGILTRGGSTVTNCSATAASESGIYVETGSVVTNCSVLSCSGTGITALNASSVIQCSAYQNGTTGILVDRGGLVADCTSRENSFAQIAYQGQCVVRDNTTSGVGAGFGSATGIEVLGTSNRIERNNCTGDRFGIRVQSQRNIFIGNTCAANTTNWNVAANNFCLVVQGIASTGFSGNSGGTSLGSTDPNANFSY